MDGKGLALILTFVWLNLNILVSVHFTLLFTCTATLIEPVIHRYVKSQEMSLLKIWGWGGVGNPSFVGIFSIPI